MIIIQQLKNFLVVFEVDELAFIDGGIPSTEDAIVQFDAGVASSAPSGVPARYS